MNRFHLLVMFALASVALALGCKRHSEPPPPLAADQMAAEFNKAFAKSPQNIRDLANEVVAAVDKKDYPKAYATVTALGSAPGLREDQRLLASRAQLTVNELLQQAQASGNQDAAAVLQMHRSSR